MRLVSTMEFHFAWLYLLLLLTTSVSSTPGVVVSATYPRRAVFSSPTFLSVGTPRCGTFGTQSSSMVGSLTGIRGGGANDEDSLGRDENDDDDDDDGGGGGGYDQYDDDDEPYDGDNGDGQELYDHGMIGPPDEERAASSGRRTRRPGSPPGPPGDGSPSGRYRPRGRKRQPAHWSQTLATKSLQATGSLAWNTLVTQPGRLAYHMIRPKHVDIAETEGLWRLDQQVVVERGSGRGGGAGGDERTLASVATIELEARRRLVTLRREGEVVSRAPYTFSKKRLSGSFQTQFVVPAFLVGENRMLLYGYRGTWQRKVADRSVIKLVGKIYQVHKQRFGKQRGDYIFGQAVGTFVARRRIQLLDDEADEDETEGDEGEDDDWEELE